MVFIIEQKAFIGHLLPGIFFAGFGAFLLFLTFSRLKSAARQAHRVNNITTAFCEQHVPEKNMRLQRIVACVLMLCTTAGILVEGINTAIIDNDPNKYFFTNAMHQTLYFLFFFVGFVGLQEAAGRLPADSVRAATALALICQILLWNEHAASKTEPTEARIHSILAMIAAGSAICMIASIYLPNRIELYVGGYLGILVQGLWLISAAIMLSQFDVMAGRVGVYFVLEIIAMSLMVVFSMAYLRHLSSQNGGSYSKIQPDNVEQSETEEDMSDSSGEAEGVFGAIACASECPSPDGLV